MSASGFSAAPMSKISAGRPAGQAPAEGQKIPLASQQTS